MENELPLNYLERQVEGLIKDHFNMPQFYTIQNLQNDIKENFNVIKKYEEIKIIELIKKVIEDEHYEKTYANCTSLSYKAESYYNKYFNQ